MSSLSSRFASPFILANTAPHHPRRTTLRVHAARSISSGDDGDKKKKTQLYEVQVVTPPERSLGMHKFPNNMSCGETIELRKRYFVVSVSETYIVIVPRTPAHARLTADPPRM